MNILFLFQRFSFESSTIYLDLVKECAAYGHSVYVLAGTSRDLKTTGLVNENGIWTAYVKLPDQFHAGKIKKGLVQLLIEPLFIRTMKRLLWDKKIDIIAYPTPPITLAGVVKAAVSRFHCRSYLMLKDIFPQNAVDLGMMKDSSPVCRYFRAMERRLYEVSDVIGCMSPANVSYVSSHNPHIKDRLELFPNTVRIRSASVVKVPEKKGPVRFVVGGNLGEPQAVDFLLEAIGSLYTEGFEDAAFLIIGDGTRAKEVREAAKVTGNLTYLSEVPRNEYEELLSQQEVGIISLSSAFTIPNFPSRLLSYMQLAKPVLVAADAVSDMGSIVTGAGCGFYVPSGDVEAFKSMVRAICKNRDRLHDMGMKGRQYLIDHYDVKESVALLERAAKRVK